ncbi:MAG: hypothetical protein DRR08_24195, partial [Candidatus Parabeggiatoa sp. nov. 2]
QVAPGAIISLRSLLRFTFNPFRVGASTAFPQVSPGAIHIQPLRGCTLFAQEIRFFLKNRISKTVFLQK